MVIDVWAACHLLEDDLAAVLRSVCQLLVEEDCFVVIDVWDVCHLLEDDVYAFPMVLRGSVEDHAVFFVS